MTLANGRPYLAIPGPSVMPDRVLRAMQRPAPNIYDGPLVELTDGLVPDLKALAGTQEQVAIYISNGHGLWEAALSNVLSPGDTVLALITGRFCQGWTETAETLGISVQRLDFGNHAAIDPDQVEAALRADTARAIKAVICVHVDTSTSVRNDIPAVSAAIKASGHDALLMVDCIAALGCEMFEMDKWGVDVMIAASQKGLMVPPGLGFVWFNARAAQRRGALVTQYWDWAPRAAPSALWEYFGGTPPTHLLYALREALDMIAEEGRAAIWARHAHLARAIWAAVACWSRGGAMRFNLDAAAIRSHAVTTLHLAEGGADRLRDWTAQKTGVTLGVGLGFDPASDTFRIGHMGHVNAHGILGALGAIEAGLCALSIPHDSGLSAAARVISEA